MCISLSDCAHLVFEEYQEVKIPPYNKYFHFYFNLSGTWTCENLEGLEFHAIISPTNNHFSPQRNVEGEKAAQCVGCLSEHDVGKRRGPEPVMEKGRDSFYPPGSTLAQRSDLT